MQLTSVANTTRLLAALNELGVHLEVWQVLTNTLPGRAGTDTSYGRRTPEPAAPRRSVKHQHEETIRADYRDNGTVTLTFADGTTRVLSQALSASGARYVSGSDEWWEHHGEATYSVNGKWMFLGKLKPKPGA